MRSTQLKQLFFILAACVVAMSSVTYARAQAKGYNLTKDVMDKKGTIVWKNAPEGAIKQDVCSLLGVCAGQTKLIAFRDTEGGVPIGHGLFLTEDAKHNEVVVLERQSPVEVYYFLLSGNGTLAKAAYASSTSTSWQLMGNALSQPTFEKAITAWQKHLAALGGASGGEEKKTGATH